MNDRIIKLRKESIDAVNRISVERARLVTDFYSQPEVSSWSVPIQRARCFEYIFMNKQLHLSDGELIVGERGEAPKATPTYPEICLHSLDDLEILNNREKVFFKVDEETRDIYKEKIIPFWEGKTNRDNLLKGMEQEWIDSYKAGVFTEFQEQRGPGHTVLGDKIYKQGMLDIIKQIDARIVGEADEAKLAELEAMKITAKSLIAFANRYAELLQARAREEANAQRKSELENMAAICRNVPAHRPETFQEALQYYWFVHLGVITELNPWDSFNPGRLDQHLLPYYQKGLADGSLTKEQTVEILQSFWIKFNNHPAPPKMGVTAKESNTYTDFSLINMGGLKADGTDAVNEMTYILLDVIEEMRLLQPSSMVQISHKNPDEFIKRTLQISKTGFGQPSYFNTDAIVQELMRQGKSEVDARNGGASGCVEAGAFGKESYILTGYFNLTKILELTLNNGFDKRTNKQLGLKTGAASAFQTFENLMDAYTKQLNYFAEIKLKGNDKVEKLYAENLPVPFLSILIDDCIENGVDYNARGARYNSSYIQGVGLGSLTDILTSLKFNIFEENKYSIPELMKAIEDDFEGHDEMRLDLIYNTPKYGNDDDYADDQAVQIFDIFFNAIDGKPTPLGGTYRINMLPTTCHVYFGSVIGATPDGRRGGLPLSEGISPFQGADKFGPTAVVKSAAKIDHIKTGGTLLNQKFAPEFFATDDSMNKLTALIRGYFKMNGHHIQFNVVDVDTLRDAQKYPERYTDLIVRVAGYSDYFNDLGVELQEEIIRRTEHKTM